MTESEKAFEEYRKTEGWTALPHRVWLAACKWQRERDADIAKEWLTELDKPWMGWQVFEAIRAADEGVE